MPARLHAGSNRASDRQGSLFDADRVMIVTDGIHLLAVSHAGGAGLDCVEIHGFAAAIGLRRAWYQGPPVTPRPHYDLTTTWRARVAIEAGALFCPTRDLARFINPRIRPNPNWRPTFRDRTDPATVVDAIKEHLAWMPRFRRR